MPSSGTVQVIASVDGLWVLVRRGLALTLHEAGAGPAVATAELDDDRDVEIVAVGPPAMFVVRSGAALAVFQPPDLECVAIARLEMPLALAAVTGQRIALVSGDGKQLRLVRAVGKSLGMHALDVGSPIEFAVGLDRNQILFGLHRKLEVWDAASGRPLLRLQLQLPPAPRAIGAAHGHLWAHRDKGDELFVYRLSDGRPFRHPIGATIERVVGQLGSQVVVLVTDRGLMRLHCLAHSLERLELPDPAMRDHALGLLATAPDEVALVGCAPDPGEVPWRAVVAGAALPDLVAPSTAEETTTPAPPLEPARSIGRFPGSGAAPRAIAPATPVAAAPPAVSSHEADTDARIALAQFATDLLAKREPKEAAPAPRGGVYDGERRTVPLESRLVEPPAIDGDATIARLASALGFATAARRALYALYGLHLVGERAAIAPLARGLGDWSEVLGAGELGAAALLAKDRDSRVRLRRGVTNYLDGAAPRAIRIAEPAATSAKPRPGMFRVGREGRTDVELVAQLGAELGRIGVVIGDLDAALLEARLHGVTAVALAPIAAPPARMPKDGAIVLVLPAAPASWVADLPTVGVAAATAS